MESDPLIKSFLLQGGLNMAKKKKAAKKKTAKKKKK